MHRAVPVLSSQICVMSQEPEEACCSPLQPASGVPPAGSPISSYNTADLMAVDFIPDTCLDPALASPPHSSAPHSPAAAPQAVPEPQPPAAHTHRPAVRLPPAPKSPCLGAVPKQQPSASAAGQAPPAAAQAGALGQPVRMAAPAQQHLPAASAFRHTSALQPSLQGPAHVPQPCSRAGKENVRVIDLADADSQA